MSVSKKAKKTYNLIFDGCETFCANIISNFIERKYLKKYITKKDMPEDFKKTYYEYWNDYLSKRQLREGVKFAWYYASQNGIYDPRYIPNTLFYTKIDQYFNNRKLGWGFNDKNYYSKIFSDIKQPDTLVRKIGGNILNADYQNITADNALNIIAFENEVICKPTLETGSGRDIRFWNTKSDKIEIMSFLQDRTQEDYIVQKVIVQHPDMDEIHSESINTIRICSLLINSKVEILSSCMRMGVGNSRVDNVTAGGISCGINNEGKLAKYAYAYYTGEKFEKHPQGLVFEDYQIPAYDKALELVKKAHPRISHFKLVSWDIAIDSEGDAVLIEPNMRKGGINLHQFSNGPLFGELTSIVMDEIFKKNVK